MIKRRGFLIILFFLGNNIIGEDSKFSRFKEEYKELMGCMKTQATLEEMGCMKTQATLEEKKIFTAEMRAMVKLLFEERDKDVSELKKAIVSNDFDCANELRIKIYDKKFYDFKDFINTPIDKNCMTFIAFAKKHNRPEFIDWLYENGAALDGQEECEELQSALKALSVQFGSML